MHVRVDLRQLWRMFRSCAIRIGPRGVSMDQMLLRAEEVQRVLGLGRSKIYEMIAAGELPVVRIGRSVRVPADALRQWVERKAAPTSAPGLKER